MENGPPSPASQELNPPTPSVAERNRRKQGRKRSAIMTALRLRSQRAERARSITAERESQRTMLMSLARRAVRGAVEERPPSVDNPVQGDRVFRRWKDYTRALASRARGWRF